ncbi:MAG TPA: DUF2786 domain-containing protein, partial [Rugosimonospora sp.]|nr:DUF2786 domain-containing protein [Rugosimonospora sp.]
WHGAAPQPAVDLAVTATLQREVETAWQRGWQPADLARMAQRRYGPPQVRLLTDALAGAMRGYAPATVDGRWAAQLRELDATVWWERDDEHLTGFAVREGLDRTAAVTCAAEVMYTIALCPPIQQLGPLPGQATPGRDAGTAGAPSTAQARQLDRIRALLAKAESTNFPEEAEAYTAKAQELMARHSIDYALLAASGTDGATRPLGRRIGVDNPYEAPKVLLLDAVSRANRCQSVWSQAYGFVTVLGFESDVDGVELLFTSLLVQATAAMVRAGSHQDAHGRSRTRSFRQSFLTAYAQRIGERLTEATRHATEAVAQERAGQGGEALLPVLASREARVRELSEELFPTLVGKQVTVSNRAGWASGRAAADHAHLRPHQAVTATS